MTPSPRFRFAEFVLSPRQRVLWRNGVAVALIPKYFDLLLLLVRRRHDAVSKDAIFAEVWSDVVVSDGALAQAIRTLRRTLGDGSREPRFIRTVSRHGYQFVWAEVIEETDDGAVGALPAPPSAVVVAPTDSIGPLIDSLLTAAARGSAAEDEARDLAERLHTLGTAEALAHLAARPGHAAALAVMRDARWSVPGAGDVPLLGHAEGTRAVVRLIALRIGAARSAVARRWAGAAVAGAAAGTAAGALGGLVLALSPGSSARPESSLALGAVGALSGAIGAGGIGAGLAAAEAVARSRRGLALAGAGAAAGAAVAAAAALLLRALMEGLFGLDLEHTGGAVDGLVMGAAAGIGYALATPQPRGGGLAAPAGGRRAAVALIVGACCAAGAVALSLAGRPLIGGLVNEIAQVSRGAPLALAPLGYLLGEPGFGPATRSLLSAFEGCALGAALAWGLTSRPGPVRT